MGNQPSQQEINEKLGFIQSLIDKYKQSGSDEDYLKMKREYIELKKWVAWWDERFPAARLRTQFGAILNESEAVLQARYASIPAKVIKIFYQISHEMQDDDILKYRGPNGTETLTPELYSYLHANNHSAFRSYIGYEWDDAVDEWTDKDWRFFQDKWLSAKRAERVGKTVTDILEGTAEGLVSTSHLIKYIPYIAIGVGIIYVIALARSK